MTAVPGYFFGATEANKLAGAAFEVAGSRFEISSDTVKDPNGPRKGREGIGLSVECFHPEKGQIPSFLKVLLHDVPAREVRNTFLVQTGLAKRHPWLFMAVPFCALGRLVKVKQISLLGHISKRIRDRSGARARDFKDYVLADQWAFPVELRRRFCGQVCCAIVALEELKLVHGDLSLGNVMIAHDPRDGDVAVLCDFDGFHHPSQPVLPMKHGGRSIRGGGSLGFQYPQFLEAGDSGAEPFIETDRFALAALVCQMMVWQPETRLELRREELLTTEMIRQRDLGPLPAMIRNRWPEGFGLLEQALRAPSIDRMPGPRIWLEAVGGPHPAMLMKIERKHPAFSQRSSLKSANGNLARVHRDLSAVSFEKTPGGLKLDFQWASPIFKKSGGRPFEKVAGPALIQPGEVVASNGWNFELS
jgi:hypothetical protein